MAPTIFGLGYLNLNLIYSILIGQYRSGGVTFLFMGQFRHNVQARYKCRLLKTFNLSVSLDLSTAVLSVRTVDWATDVCVCNIFVFASYPVCSTIRKVWVHPEPCTPSQPDDPWPLLSSVVEPQSPPHSPETDLQRQIISVCLCTEQESVHHQAQWFAWVKAALGEATDLTEDTISSFAHRKRERQR